jgi:hypothetical protein
VQFVEREKVGSKGIEVNPSGFEFMPKLWKYLEILKKAEKEQKYLGARLVHALLGQTCLGAGLVLGLDLSQGWTCLRAGLVLGPDLPKNFRAGLVQKLQGRKCLAAWNVPNFRAGSVSRPDLVRGRTSLGAATLTFIWKQCAPPCKLGLKTP